MTKAAFEIALSVAAGLIGFGSAFLINPYLPF